MANPRNEKVVEALRGQLADAKTFFLVDYQGLSAGELNALRARVRAAGGRLLVAKNTLINVVLREQGIGTFDKTLQGPTALVLIGDDPVEPAKVLTEFAKGTRDLPAAKGGMLQGHQLEADALVKIAKLPPRDQLLSELIGVLQAPLQRLVGTLQGAPRNLVSVITNYTDKLDKLKEEG